MVNSGFIKRIRVVKQVVQLLLFLLATTERWRGRGRLRLGVSWGRATREKDKVVASHLTLQVNVNSHTPSQSEVQLPTPERILFLQTQVLLLWRCAQCPFKWHKQGVSQIFFCHRQRSYSRSGSLKRNPVTLGGGCRHRVEILLHPTLHPDQCNAVSVVWGSGVPHGESSSWFLRSVAFGLLLLLGKYLISHVATSMSHLLKYHLACAPVSPSIPPAAVNTHWWAKLFITCTPVGWGTLLLRLQQSPNKENI